MIAVASVILVAWMSGCGRSEAPPPTPPAPDRVPNAVIVIHGVGNQTSGYSLQLQGALTAGAKDLHFNEVLWSDLGSLLRTSQQDKDRDAAEQEWLGELTATEQRARASRTIGLDQPTMQDEYAAARGYVGPIVRYEFLSAVERGRIQERFRAALDWAGQHADRTYVVAHSLGSVIAFDVLHAWEGGPAPPSVVFLCTLGSPLNKRLFAGHRGRPVTKPAAAGTWISFWSSNDPIAAALGGVYTDVTDREVQTSELPLSAHSSYWTHQDVVTDLVTRLR